jgi:hypothetical protein
MTSPARARSVQGARFYSWGDRNDYVSVTTILGATVPKPALPAWAARTVAEFAVGQRDLLAQMVGEGDPKSIAGAVDWLKGAPWRDRDRAANIGTAVHAYAEAIARGATGVVIPEDVAPFIPAFTQFLRDWDPEYIETEATVYSPGWGYAGTLDAVARIEGKVILLDTKTGKDVYPEVALQLAGYEGADFIGRADGRTEDPLPEIEGNAVLHLRPEGYRLVPVTVDFEAHRQWRRLVETYRYLTGPHKVAIGADLIPGAVA